MRQIARTRIRRYKPHGSALWVMCLRTPEEENRPQDIAHRVLATAERMEHPIAGFAIVLWDAINYSSCDWDIWEARIPNVLVGDFVGQRIKLEITQDSTIRRMRDDELI